MPLRYLYFVLSSGTFMTYAGWISTGERNPFARNDYLRRETDRLEVLGLFCAQLDELRRCPLAPAPERAA